MKQITVEIHHDEGVWWAESPSIPGFSSAADTLSELRRSIHEGVDFALDGVAHFIVEVRAQGAARDARRGEIVSTQASIFAGRSFPDGGGFRVMNPFHATNPRMVQV